MAFLKALKENYTNEICILIIIMFFVISDLHRLLGYYIGVLF